MGLTGIPPGWSTWVIACGWRMHLAKILIIEDDVVLSQGGVQPAGRGSRARRRGDVGWRSGRRETRRRISSSST